MHVNAPDFSLPFGGKSSAREEQRPGDGFFDALLREEEARHAREPLPPREPREATRPTNDDVRRDDPQRREAPHEAAPRNGWVEDGERPAEKTVTETHRPRGDARPTESVDDQPVATAGEAGATATSPAVSGQAVTGQPAPPEAAAAQAMVADDAEAPPVVAPDVAATVAVPQSNGAGKASAQAAQPAVTTTAATGTQTAAAQPADETAAASPETTAQPASGAAAAQRAADKASPTATSKEPNQTAAAHRQSPGVVPAGAGKQPAGDAQNSGQSGVVVTAAATVEARPAAALGGAAATAALAQGTEGQAETTGEDTSTTADAKQPLAGAKTAAQPGQTGKAPEALAAVAEKAPDAGRPPAPAAGDTASSSIGQTATPTAAAAGSVPGTGPVHNTSFAETLASARHSQAANPAEQIAVQVQRAQVAGQEQINIKLHPAELGRIEVKLEHASDGTLRAVISAERSETLDLLQRDARGLERALQDAGVKTDSGSLNFSLRGQGHGQDQQAGGNDGSGRDSLGGTPDGADSAEAMPAPPQEYDPSHSGALDIRV
jgi:flagellar hook-length control protein FliK